MIPIKIKLISPVHLHNFHTERHNKLNVTYRTSANVNLSSGINLQEKL